MGKSANWLDAVQSVRERRWIAYLVAVVGPTIGILIRFGLGDKLEGYPFITFFPAIALAAFSGGRKPGTLAALISAYLAAYFLIEPIGSLNISWPSGWLGMIFFAVTSVTMIVLVDFAVRVSARLIETTQLLRALNETLEDRVAARTRELTLLTAQLRDEIKTREAAESHVRQMQKMEAVGQLTGGIAHDFNNMLAIIIGNLQLIQRNLLQGRDILRFVDNAMDGASRAAALTRQLLAFSRQQPLAPIAIDLNALVSNMAELLRRTLGEQVILECVLAGGLWRTCVDPGQLENALLNLAVNARDAMPEGGKLTIETQNTHLDDAYAFAHPDVNPGQYVLVAVSDTGTGMPAKVIARAFDPFFTTKSEGKGTGLGLSQVHGFIKQSKGHVKIYSEIGHGTSIKIYLPRHTGDAPRASGVEPAVDESVPTGRPEEIILLVEDDNAVRHTHVSILRELNYTVLHAGSGAEALSMLQSHPATSLLFTDVMMPEMNGRVLADATRAAMPNLKVLYTTGYTPNAVVHNGIIDPDVDLLPKPFSYDQLARKVRAVLDRT